MRKIVFVNLVLIKFLDWLICYEITIQRCWVKSCDFDSLQSVR